MNNYDRPRRKPGLVCYYARWDREGRVIEARYRKVERTAPAERSETPGRRGLISIEQGELGI